MTSLPSLSAFSALSALSGRPAADGLSALSALSAAAAAAAAAPTHPTPLRPRRDPQEDTRRLVVREPDLLARINHHLFQGALDFSRGVRALTLGDGVGDSTLFLAAQLQPLGGSVVYVDADPDAAALAEERAKTRGLDNIVFHVQSLESLDEDALGRFEYVSAFGALLRARDPDAVLAAACRVLRPGGGLLLAVNGAYGWAGTDMLRRIAAPLAKLAESPAELEAMAAALPSSCFTGHPLFLGGDAEAWIAAAQKNPEALIDDLLRPHAPGLTVPEIYKLLGRHGLHMADFTHADLVDPIFSAFYHPDYFIRDPKLLEALQRLSAPERQAMAELLYGRMRLHCFYASTRPDSVASPMRLDYTPMKYPDEKCFKVQSGVVEMRTPTGYAFEAAVSITAAAMFDAIDGVRTIEQILAETRASLPWRQLSDQELGQEWVQLYANFACFGGFLLRHAAIPPFAVPADAAYDVAHGL